jgi:hypothetical protein
MAQIMLNVKSHTLAELSSILTQHSDPMIQQLLDFRLAHTLMDQLFMLELAILL